MHPIYVELQQYQCLTVLLYLGLSEVHLVCHGAHQVILELGRGKAEPALLTGVFVVLFVVVPRLSLRHTARKWKLTKNGENEKEKIFTVTTANETKTQQKKSNTLHKTDRTNTQHDNKKKNEVCSAREVQTAVY